MPNIVSVQEGKQYLGVPLDFTDDDFRIQAILDGVEDQIEQHLETKVVQTSGLTQKYRGGDKVWFTDVRPIVSVQSILDPNGNEILDTEYYLEEELGKIVFYRIVSRPFGTAGQTDRWTLTYTAGLFPTIEQVARPIKLASMMLLSRRYQRPEPGIQSMRSQDQGVAYIPNPTNSIMPPEVIELLAPYVRRSV